MPRTVVNKAFYKAAMLDNTILMNKLLNRGADIEYKDVATGFTALLVAMKYKHVRTAQFLLEKGANPMVYDPLRYRIIGSLRSKINYNKWYVVKINFDKLRYALIVLETVEVFLVF